jgi:hypothetical protein
VETVEFPLSGFRNAPFPPDEFALRVDGAPIDLTGFDAIMEVRRYPGQAEPALISIGKSTDGGDGIFFIDAPGGEIRIQIGQTAMTSAYDAAIAQDESEEEAGDRATLAYDLLLIHPDGFVEAALEGSFTIDPGVTV